MYYLKFVGKISVIKQSKAALPQLIALLNMADTTKFCLLFVISDKPTAHIPDAIVLNTEF